MTAADGFPPPPKRDGGFSPLFGDNSGVKEVLNRFQASFNENSKASITRLLTAFYFRESGDVRESEKTFEFTHKSFGEYLTAKRIVLGVQLIQEALEERQKNFRKGFDERTALVNWATLCGASAIDGYLFRFICDEMRLHNPSEVANWQKTLCRLIEFMLINGIPMEGLKHRPDFHEEMRQARNAEEALLAVLNACSRVTKATSEIKWPSPEAFGAWISRLQAQEKGIRSFIFLQCLSFLYLKNCQISDFHLSGANLEGSNLEGMEFIMVTLIKANLAGTNLANAHFAGVELQGANLAGANLSNANLGTVSFGEFECRVNLEKGNLEGANFEGANLRGVNLKGANLVGANFEGAKLQRINLNGANLLGANLRDMNILEATLKAANLRDANLEGANLQRINFNGANLLGTILEGKDIASLTKNPNEDTEES